MGLPGFASIWWTLWVAPSLDRVWKKIMVFWCTSGRCVYWTSHIRSKWMVDNPRFPEIGAEVNIYIIYWKYQSVTSQPQDFFLQFMMRVFALLLKLVSTQRCPQLAILSEQMFGRCVINKTQLSSFKIPCLRLYCSYHGIYQVHGDGCFDTGPISLSLTGNYPDVHHHGHKTLWESSQQEGFKICPEPALKRLHGKRIHLLLWSLRGYGNEVIRGCS